MKRTHLQRAKAVSRRPASGKKPKPPIAPRAKRRPEPVAEVVAIRPLGEAPGPVGEPLVRPAESAPEHAVVNPSRDDAPRAVPELGSCPGEPARAEAGRQQSPGRRASDWGLLTELAESIRTQEALWRITAELDGFFDLSPDLFCVANVEGRLRRLNPAWEKLTGYRLEHLLGRQVLDFVHPDDRRETSAALRGLAQGETLVNHAMRFRCRDGSYRSLGWSAAPYGDDLVFAVARDMTEQKQTDEALQKDEMTFRVLAEISPVGIFRTDPSGGCVYANPRWCEIAGMTPRRARGQGWIAGLHPDDRRRVAEEWHRAARKETPFDAEFRFKRTGGPATWVVGHAVAVKDPAGEVVGYVGTIADITSRKRHEKETSELVATLERRVADGAQQLERAHAELAQARAELAQVSAKHEKEILTSRRANSLLVVEVAQSRRANAELVRELALSRRAGAAAIAPANARLREQASTPRPMPPPGKRGKS